MTTSAEHAVPAPTTAKTTTATDDINTPSASKPAKVLCVVKNEAAPTKPKARSARKRLQVNVTDGCTAHLSDISDALNISAIRLCQSLDALHLRDRRLPTPEATRRGLAHRWYAGSQFMNDWHISGVTEVVTAYFDSTGWPSKPIPKAKPTALPCRSRRGEG